MKQKWAIMRQGDIEALGLSTYNGEVILIDYGANPIRHDSFYFNAQEFFSEDELEEMPYLSLELLLGEIWRNVNEA